METQIVNISLPKSLLAAADKRAKGEFRSRSELFREAIRTYLLDRQEWERLFAYGESRAKKLGLKSKDVEKLIGEYRTGR